MNFRILMFHIYFCFFSDFEVINPPKNGSLCKAIFNSTFAENTKSFTDFQLTNFPNDTLSSCFDTEGSHSKTFWIYFVLRMGYQISLISCYSSLDGTALRQSREFNSDYSWVSYDFFFKIHIFTKIHIFIKFTNSKRKKYIIIKIHIFIKFTFFIKIHIFHQNSL